MTLQSKPKGLNVALCYLCRPQSHDAVTFSRHMYIYIYIYIYTTQLLGADVNTT